MATAKKKKTKAAAAEPVVEIQPGLRENVYPTVAIVGRPNVGKSSLFNALIRKQVSITDARAGTTRDRVLHPIQFQERACDLMDTGGIGIVDAHNLSAHIEDQIAAALHTATILVLVVDSKDGLTTLDREIASRLRKHNMPIVVAANKCEGIEAGYTVGEFESLGFSPVIATSAAHRLGLEDLENAIAAHLPEKAHELSDGRLDNIPKIALCGRRNVGKSSFCNALAKQDRVIVSDMPGTTRDSVDLMMEKDDRKFCLIDTAGLRRMKEPEGPAEFYSQVRTERAIRRADVIMLMVDAVEGFSTTDRKTADMIIEMCKPCVIVVNKWDLAPGAVTGEYAKYVEGRLPTLRHSPICFTSAKSGTRCWQTLDVALDLYDLARTEIPTPVINKAVERAEREHEPPARKGKKPRLLYGLQVGVLPPTFVIHGRHTKLIDSKYKRYLNLRLGKFLGLSEIPLRLFLRDSSRK